MREQKLLDHACPTCKGEVWALRSDRKYCAIVCKNKHHASEKWHFAGPEMDMFKFKRKNVKILDGLIGQDHTSATIKITSLENFNFRLKYCDIVDDSPNDEQNRIKVKTFELLNFKLTDLGNDFLKITRIGKTGSLAESEEDIERKNIFYRRWLLEFPIINHKLFTKNEILNSGNVWRE